MEEQKRRRERKSAAYWLSKSSILYPICILYVMYVKQVEVYITECSVHISSGTMLFAYALCLILWLASPIRSYCADGTANEVLFYAFPPSILMLFLFAQYSLKIVLFFAVLDGIFLVTVLRDLHRKKRKYSPKKFWRLKRSDLNAFLFVSVCVSMVPTCMMIYWKLESPSGVAELYERKKDYNLVQNQENIFQENKELDCCFSPCIFLVLRYLFLSFLSFDALCSYFCNFLLPTHYQASRATRSVLLVHV